MSHESIAFVVVLVVICAWAETRRNSLIADVFSKSELARCAHQWGQWEQKEIKTSTSFHSRTALVQVRKCGTCGFTASKEIHEVSA